MQEWNRFRWLFLDLTIVCLLSTTNEISDGPHYINDNFPLIDKMKKCTVERILPDGGGDDVGYEPDNLHAPGGGEEIESRPKLLRNTFNGEKNVLEITNPEQGLMIGAGILVVVAIVAAVRGHRKNESKTQ